MYRRKSSCQYLSMTDKIPVTRNSAYSCVKSKHIVMPQHANPNGLMFGGILLAWIDMAAAMVAEKHSGMDVATIHVEAVHFSSPILIGQHVSIEARLVKTGNTSMKIEVQVSTEDAKSGTVTEATKAILTFVAVDHEMKPRTVPKLCDE